MLLFIYFAAFIVPNTTFAFNKICLYCYQNRLYRFSLLIFWDAQDYSPLARRDETCHTKQRARKLFHADLRH